MKLYFVSNLLPVICEIIILIFLCFNSPKLVICNTAYVDAHRAYLRKPMFVFSYSWSTQYSFLTVVWYAAKYVVNFGSFNSVSFANAPLSC